MRSCRIRAALLPMAILGGVICAGQAPKPKRPVDVLVFINGDQLQGTLIRGVGQEIVFKSDMAGEVTISLDKVKELRSAENFAVLNKDVPATRQRVEPGSLSVRDGSMTVITGADSVRRTLLVKDVGYIIDQTTYDRDLVETPRFYQGVSGTISAGATLVRSTQNVSTFTAGANFVQALPLLPFLPKHSRTTLNLADTYGKQTQPVIPQTSPPTPALITKTDIFHAGLERDRYFSPRFYALVESAFDHNFSQGLNLQQLYGLGFGWTLFETPRQQFDLKGDVHYEKQQFETVSSNQNLIGSLIAEGYRRNLPRKVVLTENAGILPAWNNLTAYSANATVALSLPLFQRFALTLSSTDNFINNPAVGFKKNSLQFVTGISYSLR